MNIYDFFDSPDIAAHCPSIQMSKEYEQSNVDQGHDLPFEIGAQKFVWNSLKAESIITKHGIFFEEAATILIREDTRTFHNSDNSDIDEDWFISVGFSNGANELAVIYYMRDKNNVIRIYSARRATDRDKKLLEDFENNIAIEAFDFYDFSNMRSVPNPWKK